MNKLIFIFLIGVLFCACNKDSDYTNKTIILGESVNVKLNETVTDHTSYLRLRLDAVVDSRCPINAECLTSGNAEVTFTFFVNGNPSVFTLNTTIGAKETYVNGYKITLLELLPFPGSSDYSLENLYAVVTIEKV